MLSDVVATTTARENTEGRVHARARSPGWATVDYAGSSVKSERLYDLSQTGLALFLDVQLALHHEYHIKLSVYRNGKTHALDVRARCVYSTLVGVSGFRHGFQFLSMTEECQESLRNLLA